MKMRDEDRMSVQDVRSHPLIRDGKKVDKMSVQDVKSSPLSRTGMRDEMDENRMSVQIVKSQPLARTGMRDEKNVERMSVQDVITSLPTVRTDMHDGKDEERMSVKDVKSLPLIRTEIREKEDCPGVTQKVEYRLRTKEDGNDEEIALSYVNDEILDNPIAVNINLLDSWLISSMVIRTRPYLNCLGQDDEKLIKIIREDYLKHPTRTAGNPYNFSVPVKDLDYEGDAGQAGDIDDLFDNNLYGGFYIEAGSLDSEHMSTSLLLEVKRNWTGLLIEPTPHCHAEGLLKNRRATHIQTCLASERRPHYVFYDINEIFQPANMKKKQLGGRQYSSRSVDLQCLPIYSVIQTVGNITIHYFSLDIAGAELKVN